MAMRSIGQSNVKGGTWKGILLLLFLTVLSVLNVDILGQSVSFIFLPLIAIFLWPRTEKPIASIIFILFFGLLLDIISTGPLGLWSLIFLSIFTIFGPYRRSKPLKFLAAYRLWFAALLLALLAAYFLGWFAIGSRPDVKAMLYQAFAAITLFPLIYGFRHVARSILLDSDRGGL